MDRAIDLSSKHESLKSLNDLINDILHFSGKNREMTCAELQKRISASNMEQPLESVVAVLESLGVKVVDRRHIKVEIEDLDSTIQHNSGSAPCNPVGMYLRNASSTRLLSRDEERAWFQVIEASSERMFDLFSRYPFAARMYIRELDHLASGNQHFDSIVSESSGMSCTTYKKAIPEFREGISEAIDVLVGASALYRSMSDDPDSESAAELLRTARESMKSILERLSFRKSIVEDFCDVAYEDVYLRYVRYAQEPGSAEDTEASAQTMFGMSLHEFLESFSEIRCVLDIIHEARSRIAEANLRLVAHVAKKYANRGMDLSDILQDGSIGLMNAIRKFDMSRGHKFSTFATWWIRQAISRALTNNSRTIRIPSHKIDQLNKLDKAERELSQELCRLPSDDEVASRLGMSADEVRQLHDIRMQTVSLNGPLGDDEDSSLMDVVKDDGGFNPADEAEKRFMGDKIRESLSVLSKRERMIIDMRFGLSDGNIRTLEDIGRVFNVTREHIRRMELVALAKLKSSNVLLPLAELVR